MLIIKLVPGLSLPRLQRVLSSVLHEDQTCGVPGRSIFSNLYLIRDLIEYCSAKNLPLAIISLDQEKAFDRVNWNFLDRVLQKMNVEPEFRQWIRVIYSEISSACLHSGFVTSFSEISRGAHQGDPLSSLLYTWWLKYWGQLLGIAKISGGFAYLVDPKNLKLANMRMMEI